VLQASFGGLLRLDASDAWFNADPTASALFPLADLFKDPTGSTMLNL
jgi:hypothetical protein